MLESAGGNKHCGLLVLNTSSDINLGVCHTVLNTTKLTEAEQVRCVFAV